MASPEMGWNCPSVRDQGLALSQGGSFSRYVYHRQPPSGLRPAHLTKGQTTMNFYTRPHRFYAGGDLHASSLYLHVLDDQGQTRFQQDLPATHDAFLHATHHFRDGLVGGVECIFSWYWRAGLCADHYLPI